jgi:hypothetical protein
MRVVELNGHFFWEQLKVRPHKVTTPEFGRLETTDDVLQIKNDFNHALTIKNSFFYLE